MWKTMLVGGLVLVVLGLLGYVASGGASVTALIPAFFGAPIVLLAIVAAKAKNDSTRMHAVHGAMALFLLGALGSARGLVKLPALLSGTAERPLAIAAQVVMFVVCLFLLALGFRSFLAARAARARGA